MFTFPFRRDKRRSVATSLMFHYIQMTGSDYVVSAGDFTGDRLTFCWSILESILALVCFLLGVYFTALHIYLFSLHPMCVLLSAYWIWLDCLDFGFLGGWVVP